jgi:lysophospholipase L1-like esterase
VKQTSFGLALFAAVVAAGLGFVLARNHYARPVGSDHRTARQLVLYFALSHVDNPIIVLGDSIVEASSLPSGACGHPIVNAGLSGASTASDLGAWLAPALANKRAFAIIVALGTNDALTPRPITKQAFETSYASLLRDLSKLTTRLFVLDIPPVEVRERMTPEMQRQVMATIREFRSVLPELAARNDATFLPLPEMTAPFTVDGVHLNAEGYRAWDAAISGGTARACG